MGNIGGVILILKDKIRYLRKYDAQVKYLGRARASGMCGEYWRCYPNPGIGRHNTLAVGRIENSTLQLIFHTRRDWRVFQKKEELMEENAQCLVFCPVCDFKC